MTGEDVVQRPGRLWVPRTRGALSGFLLLLLGAWGALIPFIGPYFSYSFAPDDAWTWTTGRGWLEVLPGAVTAVGGLLLLVSSNRLTASLGGWLAAAGGAWFVSGRTLSQVWSVGTIEGPTGSTTVARVTQELGFFTGLGVVIVFLAAHALGRMSVRSVRDVRAAERRVGQVETAADVDPRGHRVDPPDEREIRDEREVRSEEVPDERDVRSEEVPDERDVQSEEVPDERDVRDTSVLPGRPIERS